MDKQKIQEIRNKRAELSRQILTLKQEITNFENLIPNNYPNIIAKKRSTRI